MYIIHPSLDLKSNFEVLCPDLAQKIRNDWRVTKEFDKLVGWNEKVIIFFANVT